MSGTSTKIRRLIYHLKKDYLTLNNVVLVLSLIFCASWAWASVTTMTRNWELEEKLESRQMQQAKLQFEIAKLQLEQEYYRTAEYQELVARDKQGKMLAGETMVILPKNSESAKNKYAEGEITTSKEPSNLESWLSFLFPSN